MNSPTLRASISLFAPVALATVLVGLGTLATWLTTSVQAQLPATQQTQTQDGDAAVLSEARVDPVVENARAAVERGRAVFRYDTFGSNLFFNDQLHLNETVEQLSPVAALGLGLKVDFDVLPPSIRQAIKNGAVDLNDPAVTAALLKQSAVIGLVARVDAENNITDLGITCSLCHTTVDNRIAPGIGSRLDGWPNRDLNVGAIIAASPTVQPIADTLGLDQETVRAVLNSWGPGKFDAHLNLDGKAFRPDGESGSVLIPPVFGLAGVNLATYGGWGSVTYWNAFVSVLEMNGSGRFFDSRLDDAERFPVAAAKGFGHRDGPQVDLTTSKLADLHAFQLALPSPMPPQGSFDVVAADRGYTVFNGKAQCATCHVPPLYTDPGWNMHTPEEIGIDSFQADRAPDGMYRTTPLKGLWTHGQGGYYHDGRFATLQEVIGHYNSHMELGLTLDESNDLEQFLLSL